MGEQAWPVGELGACVKGEDANQHEGLFKRFRKILLASDSDDVDNQVTHAEIVWEFLIVFCSKFPLKRHQILECVAVLNGSEAWRGVINSKRALQEKMKELPEDVRSSFSAQPETLLSSSLSGASIEKLKPKVQPSLENGQEEVQREVVGYKEAARLRGDLIGDNECTASQATRDDLSEGIQAVLAIDTHPKWENDAVKAFTHLRRACLHLAGDTEALHSEANHAPGVLNFLIDFTIRNRLRVRQACELLHLIMACSAWATALKESTILQERVRTELGEDVQAAFGLQSEAVMDAISAGARKKAELAEAAECVDTGATTSAMEAVEKCPSEPGSPPPEELLEATAFYGEDPFGSGDEAESIVPPEPPPVIDSIADDRGHHEQTSSMPDAYKSCLPEVSGEEDLAPPPPPAPPCDGQDETPPQAPFVAAQDELVLPIPQIEGHAGDFLSAPDTESRFDMQETLTPPVTSDEQNDTLAPPSPPCVQNGDSTGHEDDLLPALANEAQSDKQDALPPPAPSDEQNDTLAPPCPPCIQNEDSKGTLKVSDELVDAQRLALSMRKMRQGLKRRLRWQNTIEEMYYDARIDASIEAAWCTPPAMDFSNADLWEEALTPDGKKYFWNTRSRETRWSLPAGALSAPVPSVASEYGLKLGSRVEVFSNSHQAWCSGFVEKLCEQVSCVSFNLPGASKCQLARKDIPYGSKDLRLLDQSSLTSRSMIARPVSIVASPENRNAGGLQEAQCLKLSSQAYPNSSSVRSNVGGKRSASDSSSETQASVPQTSILTPDKNSLHRNSGFKHETSPSSQSKANATSISGFPHIPPEERACYDMLFQKVVAQFAGAPEGIPQYLASSGLPRKAMKEIWSVANPEMKPVLNAEAFARACRLVAHCQAMRKSPPHQPLLIQGERPLRVFLREKCLGRQPHQLPHFG